MNAEAGGPRRVVLLVAMCACYGCEWMVACPPTGVKQSKQTVTATATRLEAARASMKRCPTPEEASEARTRDAWGRDLRISCEQNPALSIVATSAGRDGKFGTPDDIRSDE
jgi:hypothetical protein